MELAEKCRAMADGSFRLRYGEGTPMPMEQRLRVAAVVRDRNGAILLVQHFNRARPFWTFPGGAPEGTETPVAAIVREVAEETGYTIEVAGVLCVGALVTDRWEPPKVEIFFRATTLSHRLPTSGSGESIIDARFFARNEIPSSFRPREVLPLLEDGMTVPFVDIALQPDDA
jgi:ADP-ribose pyrophosphatase YjhB (NUDIX family)